MGRGRGEREALSFSLAVAILLKEIRANLDNYSENWNLKININKSEIWLLYAIKLFKVPNIPRKS